MVKSSPFNYQGFHVSCRSKLLHFFSLASGQEACSKRGHYLPLGYFQHCSPALSLDSVGSLTVFRDGVDAERGKRKEKPHGLLRLFSHGFFAGRELIKHCSVCHWAFLLGSHWPLAFGPAFPAAPQTWNSSLSIISPIQLVLQGDLLFCFV